MVDYSPALMTDMYEYTMLDAALKDGTADRKCVFEVFTRHLPEGRRYGVVDHASYVPTKQKPAIAKRHNATMNLMHRVYRFASGPYGAAGVLAGRDDYGRCDRPP